VLDCQNAIRAVADLGDCSKKNRQSLPGGFSCELALFVGAEAAHPLKSGDYSPSTPIA
jgi:hypothetical protein